MADSKNKVKGKAAQLPRGDPEMTPEKVIRNRRDRLMQKHTIIAFLTKLVLIVLAFWLIFTFLFGIGIVDGEEMYPRLRDGDMYFYYRIENEYHIGDVVSFTSNGYRYVGRIVARAGDTVDMSETGELLVNGNAQDEEIFYPTYKTDAITEFPCTLQKDQVFLLCDLRTEGADSRTYGAISLEMLDGKIITVLRRRGI